MKAHEQEHIAKKEERCAGMEELKDYLEASRARKESLESKEKNPAHIKNHVDRAFDYMAMLNTASHTPIKLNTGIAAVDKVTGGLGLGELVAINGDSGSGRTALALHYAIDVAEKTGKPVRIYSQAHSAHQITMRLLSMLTGIPISVIETAQFYDYQYIQLATAANWLGSQDICVYDMAMSVEQILDSFQFRIDFALLIIDGAPMCELEPKTIRNMSLFARQMECCVMFNGNYLSVAPYIEGKVDKVLNLEHLEDDAYRFELRWTELGKRGHSCLYWNKTSLSFTDEPLYIVKKEDDCV